MKRFGYFSEVKLAALLSIAAAVLGGCSEQVSPPTGPPPQTSVNIKADGTILVDGRKCELKEFGPILDAIKAQGGMILYKREKTEGPAPASVKMAVNMIIQRQIKIKILGGHGMSKMPTMGGHPPIPGMQKGHGSKPGAKTAPAMGEHPKKPAGGSSTKKTAPAAKPAKEKVDKQAM